MKKFVLLAVLVAAMPLTTMAQDDDLYFNPKQEAKKEAALREQRAKAYARVRAVRDSLYAIYWSGSPRSVDEYNRNGRILSHYQGITTDSLGNDIISFRLEKGVKPDSIYDDEAFAQKFINQDEDFEYTRDLSRWDGYYNPWFYDYYGVGPYYWRSGYWGWRNPWRYGYYAGWYDPWFDPFYDPWYYGYAGWYGGWYSPWYGWGGYYNPWYWGGPMIGHVHYSGNPKGYAGNRSWNGQVIILAAIMAEGMITRMAIVTSAIVPTVITTIVSAIPTALTIVIPTSVALATEVVTLEEVVSVEVILAAASAAVALEEAHVPAEAAALVAEDKKCNISNLFKVWKS